MIAEKEVKYTNTWPYIEGKVRDTLGKSKLATVSGMIPN